MDGARLAFNESLAHHIEELQRRGYLPNNWAWHPAVVRQLQDIDTKLLEDVLSVHAKQIMYRNRLLVLLRQLEDALRTLAEEMAHGNVPITVQTQQANVINRYLEEVKKMLVVKRCRIEQHTGYLGLFSDKGTTIIQNTKPALVAATQSIIAATKKVCGEIGFVAVNEECGAYLDNQFTPRNGFQMVIFSAEFLETEAPRWRWAAKFTGVMEPERKNAEAAIRSPAPTVWTLEVRNERPVIIAYVSKIAQFYEKHPGGFAAYRRESASILEQLKTAFEIVPLGEYADEYDLFELRGIRQ